MNTLNKVKELQREIRNLKHDINMLTSRLSKECSKQRKTNDRLNSLEELLLSKFEEIFSGEDNPIGEIETRIKNLEILNE